MEQAIKDIFHYTKMETALEKILPQRKLRLGQMGFTNDPRESKFWNSPKPYWMNPNADQIKQNKILQKVLDKQVHTVMKEEWKVLCFTLEHEPLKEIDNQSEQLRKYLNRGSVRPRMWAQYADNHKGVCLWFDGNKLDENLNKELGKRCEIFRGNVLYNVGVGIVIPPLPRTISDDIQNLGEKGAARKFVIDHYEDFFLRKNTDWESEWEYRWLIHSERRSPEFVSICGAIKGVIVGVDFPKVYEPSLRLVCEGLGISAGRVNWENGVPNVDWESICHAQSIF